MRPILENPIGPEVLTQTTKLAQQIYAFYEAGQPYDHLLTKMSEQIRMTVTPIDVHEAFGSVSPQSFAFDLHVRSLTIPIDLSYSEMLELVQQLLQPKRDELRTSFWLTCLKRNTGDTRFSDLIYWPGEYFGDGDNSRELSAEEIIRTAIANGGTYIGT